MIHRQQEVEERIPRSVGTVSTSTSNRPAPGSMDALTGEFMLAQQRLLDRFGVAAESRFVDVPVVGRAHVLVAGEGPPVMMVIGGTLPAAMWTPLMARLEGFTLYAVDLPGFGLTDATAHSTANMRPLAVTFLEQVLDGLGLDRALFVGSSLGATWATWLALDQPERVTAMVHIGCPALILGTSAPIPMRLLSVPPVGRFLMRLQPPSARQVDRVAAMAGEDFSELPELREALLACEKLPSYGPASIRLLHALVRPRGARPEVALTAEQLAQLRQPVQMIWGEHDPFGSPAVGKRACEVIPEAELHVVPGGHGPWFRYAEQVGDLAVPFLRKHTSTPPGRRIGQPWITLYSNDREEVS